MDFSGKKCLFEIFKYITDKNNPNTKQNIKLLLFELIIDKESLDSYLKSKRVFDESMVVVDASSLSDSFIVDSFNLESLRPYFSKDAWQSVISVLKVKKQMSACLVCSKICLDGCIQCTKCLFWFHFSCEDLSEDDFNKDLSKVWLCLKYVIYDGDI